MYFAARKFTNLLLQVIVGLAIVFGLPTYLAVTRIHYGHLIDSKAQDLKSLATSVSAVFSQNLKERSREIELLAQSPLYVRALLGSADVKSSLMRVQKTYPLYSWIGVADLNGTVQSATRGMLETQSVAQRPWFQHAQKGLYVGDLHEAKLLGDLLKPQIHEWPIRFIDFAAPIRDEKGAIRGVLCSHVHWSWAKELVNSLTPSYAKEAQIDVFLLNRNNEVIFPEALAINETNFSSLTTNTGRPAQFISWGGDELYLTAVSPIQSAIQGIDLDWKVVVRQPRAQVISQVTELERTIFLIFVVAGLAFAVLVWWGVIRMVRPIQQLAQVAQAIADGKRAQFNVKTNTKELAHLRETLSSMAKSLWEQRQNLESMNRDLEQKIAERTVELTEANKALEALTRQDELTGLANRLAANQWLDAHFRLMKRHHLPYALLVMDVDFFKKVNDTYGHATGDTVLSHVATILMRSVRETDLVARVGGEEFLAILPMTSMVDARTVAEKIRSAVESSPIEPVGTVTMSIGIAMASPEDSDTEAAVKAADAMLYEAKRDGRNRVKSSAG